jgi:hypothetical protein
MKKIIFGILIAALFSFTPQYSEAASIKVTSPVKNTTYYFGDIIPITWSERSKGVSSISIVPAAKGAKGAISLYGPMVYGDPINYSGKFEYQLPNYYVTPPGKYKIQLTTASGKKIYSPVFTINSSFGEEITTIKKAKYKIGKVTGFKKTYAPGESINFSVEAFEYSKVIATPYNSFHIQAHSFDPKNRYGGAYEAVNATYDDVNDRWNIQMKAPSGLQNYIIEVSLYCGNVGPASYCAKTYGTNNQVTKTLKFKVK